MDAEAAARRLVAEGWGAYVALWPTPNAGPSILRDPSGALEALSWTYQGASVVSSSAPSDLEHLLGPKQILWERVGAWLTDTTEIAGDLALSGIGALSPGEFFNGETQGRVHLWLPAEIARTGSTFRRSRRSGDLAHALCDVVDRTTAALPIFGECALVEVSGGLDSAVVAASVRKVGGLHVGSWLNFRGRDPGADETAYACEVAALLGVELDVREKAEVRLTEQDLASVSSGVRPGLNGMDPQYDRDVLAQAQGCGANMIVTGQGGDTIFHAGISSWQAGEVLSEPWWPRRSRRLNALAVELQTSARLLAAAGRRALRSPPTTLGARLSLCHPELAPLRKPTVPWVAELDGLMPAKRHQILQLAHSLLYRTDCERGRAFQLVHVPLLQPIVDFCLGLSVEELTPNAEGRGLLKRAFFDCVPAWIRHRRSKGDFTAYYGRMIAGSLHVVRPFLLDGLLAEKGLIDRREAESRLDPDDLAWRGGYADLMDVIAIEAWARRWSR